MMMLRPSVNNSFPEHISESSRPIVLNFTHNTPRGSSCAFWGIWTLTYFSGFWTLTLKLTQHFDLIYNISKSDWKILGNIMKTAQDSYTITIKQIVRFQERMHLEKFQVDKIKNGRLSAIIHLDRPDKLRNIMKTAQGSYAINIK